MSVSLKSLANVCRTEFRHVCIQEEVSLHDVVVVINSLNPSMSEVSFQHSWGGHMGRAESAAWPATHVSVPSG